MNEDLQIALVEAENEINGKGNYNALYHAWGVKQMAEALERETKSPLKLAAPDLLEACKKVMEAAEMQRNWDILGKDEFNERYPDDDGWSSGDIDENLLRAIEIARAAIAKAEG